MDGSSNVREAPARLRRSADAFIARLKAAKQRRLALMIVPPALAALIAAAWIMLGSGVVSTDDATIAAARAPISASVRGRVVKVLVREDQRVRAGDVLFQLDDADFKTALMRAEGQYGAAQLQVAA